MPPGMYPASHSPRNQKAGLILYEYLQCSDKTEDDHLNGHPDSWPDALEDDVGQNLENNNTKEHQLIAKIDGILVHANVLRKAIGERAGQVHAVQLENE
jgi:hypothetical protein